MNSTTDRQDKYTDIMIDMETLDIRPTSVILSIAAIAFNRSDENYNIAPFDVKIDSLDQADSYHRTIDPDTEKWWEQQSDEAKDAAFNGQITLRHALHKLTFFIRDNSNIETVRVWAKSPSFDLAILKNALDYFKYNTPWQYQNERDVRTYIADSPEVRELKRNNVEHVAVSDAIYQTTQVLLEYQSRNK
ncbi:3'-5' exonuclease [Sphingobacterium sp.]|uniref:3'-5' exonuclease n=1 Tax=Sphingobacterium sp. TaxID=341027 RepID=UPI0028A799A1|nr:3'-5' exonuclease [Sphingobacterium sp.]